MGEFLAVMAAFFFAASNIYANQGMIETDYNRYEGLFVSVVVNNITNLVLLPFYLLVFSLPEFNLQGVVAYILAGFSATFLGRYLLFECIERVKASRATVLKITAPVFTVIIGVTLLNESLSPWELVGIAVVLIGVVVVSLDTQNFMNNAGKSSPSSASASSTNNNENSPSSTGSQSAEEVDSQRRAKIGIILGVFAGLALGSGNVFRKLGTDFMGGPFFGVLIGSFTALVVLAIVSLASGKIQIRYRHVLLPPTLSWAYVKVGVWTSIAMYTIFVALDLAPVSIVNSLASVEPFGAIILSAIMLKKHDIITLRLLLGGTVVIAGSVLIFMF